MRSTVKQLKEMRRKLETLTPQTGSAKWTNLLSSFRVAGVPRSVATAIRIAIFEGVAADISVGPKMRELARTAIENFKKSAAYKEIAWLDQKQLKGYLAEYRANGYQEPTGFNWAVNRETPVYYENWPA